MALSCPTHTDVDYEPSFDQFHRLVMILVRFEYDSFYFHLLEDGNLLALVRKFDIGQDC